LRRRRFSVRTLLASAALAGAVALAGCETDGVSIPSKALKELPPETIALLEQKRMPKESPMLARIFKEEAELEIWKQDDTGRFALLKTYPICRWSGDLGPKFKEGDRQAPEGFYHITPGLMNPNSAFYLSFNLGYPNAFDKAHDRTGAQLMVHGDCSSRGCYAMTDDQISEIYALARESFFGGQKSFQVQAFPFRMTPVNMARHRNSTHMSFWKMIKQGYDHFEVTRLEPKVDVCEKRYVFDAASPDGKPLRFDPRGRCPTYEVSQDIAAAVAQKQQRDEQESGALAWRTPTAPSRAGIDGGMHPSFLAKLKTREMMDSDGRVRVTAGTAAPVSMGNNVVPPRTTDGAVIEAAASDTTGSASRQTTVASAGPSLTDRLFGMFKSSPTPQPVETKLAGTPTPKPKPSPAARPAPTAVSAQASAPARREQQQAEPAAATEPQLRAWPGSQPPAATANPPAAPAQAQAASRSTGTSGGFISGAQPALSSSSFDSRFGGMR
jgi:murein L,D-transpeptidase YafK